MSTSHAALRAWVEETAKQVKPERVHWCDGSEAENSLLMSEMVKDGTLVRLNEAAAPGCTLHRSHPSDVARTEHLTFICSDAQIDAGPTNHWLSPADARVKVWPLFDGAMKGRTMYVVPYLMGPAGSPYSKVGVEITDSAYVAASMRIMTRMGKVALDHLGSGGEFCKGLHSLGDLNPERRFICHFPSTREIWSIGSGYGGNALLGKKCFALRIASVMGRDQGWMAEHMLIVGLESPEGKTTYVAAAFPSQCGKTNLAMLIPPASQKGWKVWTVGDDIAWLHPGPDGRLYAINPEAGFFGVAPGTNNKTNPSAMATIQKNTIFTNVAVTKDGRPWWEGLDKTPPEGLTDWRGQPYDPASGPAAHPNSRFTVDARQCPSVSPMIDAAEGVPISAIIFGGRRASVAPLVYEARSWAHGVYLGATMASETTAAATGKVGVVRRDPMAMRPFCGYHVGDYFGHWLKMGEGRTAFPKVFHVNWFRTDGSGRYLWPGFGENLRVLRWIAGRVDGTAKAKETPIGFMPTPGDLDQKELNVSAADVETLLSVSREEWTAETNDVANFFGEVGERLPAELESQRQALLSRLSAGS